MSGGLEWRRGREKERAGEEGEGEKGEGEKGEGEKGEGEKGVDNEGGRRGREEGEEGRGGGGRKHTHAYTSKIGCTVSGMRVACVWHVLLQTVPLAQCSSPFVQQSAVLIR